MYVLFFIKHHTAAALNASAFINFKQLIQHSSIKEEAVRTQIRQQRIRFAGNAKLKIYGRLNCFSGKRMKKENRVFFQSEKEALQHRFRPCGHCMKEKYKKWKHEFIHP